jgi:hypothetical protein
LLLASCLPAGAQRPHPDPLQPSYSGSNYSDTLLSHYQETPVAYVLLPSGENYVVNVKASIANNHTDPQFADCELIAALDSSPAPFPPVTLDRTRIRLMRVGKADRQAIALQASLCTPVLNGAQVAVLLECSTYDGKVKEAVVTATRVPAIAATGSSPPAPLGAFGSCVQQTVPMVVTGLTPQSLNGSPDPYHSTVTIVGSGFQPGDTLQIVFRNLPDVVPDVCMVCAALHSHLEDVTAPALAQVGADGTFQVAEVVLHNIEGGSSSNPVTILVESTGGTPRTVEAIGTADASYWIGALPADL